MTGLVTEPQTVTQQPIGPLRDPAGDFSSKRLESFIAFVAAIVVVFLDVALSAGGIKLGNVPIVELVGTLLAYSAAMQGVSAFSERNLFPNGLNTSIVGRLIDSTVSAAGSTTSLAGEPSSTGAAK